MKRIIRLTENDLARIVRRVIKEQDLPFPTDDFKADRCRFPDDNDLIKENRDGLEYLGFKCLGTNYNKVRSNLSSEPTQVLRNTTYGKDIFALDSTIGNLNNQKNGTLYIMLGLDTFGKLNSPGDMTYYYVGSDGKEEEGPVGDVGDVNDLIKKYQKYQRTKTSVGTALAVYVVKRGDTLYDIAKKMGVEVDDIIISNPQIENPNKIYPGMKIRIER